MDTPGKSLLYKRVKENIKKYRHIASTANQVKKVNTEPLPTSSTTEGEDKAETKRTDSRIN
jgi:hypothetical protein